MIFSVFLLLINYSIIINMEFQIAEILKNIKKTEIRTMDQIRERREGVIDNIIEDFMCYPNNEGKGDLLKEELDEYEYIEFNDIYKYDTIKILNMNRFFDLSTITGVCISKKDDKIRIRNKSNKYRFIKSDHYFRKLTNQDLVKISLIESLYNNTKN